MNNRQSDWVREVVGCLILGHEWSEADLQLPQHPDEDTQTTNMECDRCDAQMHFMESELPR